MTYIYRYVMQFSSNRSLDRPAENVNPGLELRHYWRRTEVRAYYGIILLLFIQHISHSTWYIM